MPTLKRKRKQRRGGGLDSLDDLEVLFVQGWVSDLANPLHSNFTETRREHARQELTDMAARCGVTVKELTDFAKTKQDEWRVESNARLQAQIDKEYEIDEHFERLHKQHLAAKNDAEATPPTPATDDGGGPCEPEAGDDD